MRCEWSSCIEKANVSLSSPSRLLAYQQPSCVRADRSSPSMDLRVASIRHPVCSVWSYPVWCTLPKHRVMEALHGATDLSLPGWLSGSDHGAIFLSPFLWLSYSKANKHPGADQSKDQAVCSPKKQETMRPREIRSHLTHAVMGIHMRHCCRPRLRVFRSRESFWLASLPLCSVLRIADRVLRTCSEASCSCSSKLPPETRLSLGSNPRLSAN